MPAQAESSRDSEPAPRDPVPQEPAPAPSPPPAVSFDIGADFDQVCSVAWPTAPVVTSTMIQLTLYCPEVPSTYQLVVVGYPDPSLPVDPGTGNMRVVGQVVDVAESALGITYLMVQATSITL